MFIWSGCIVAVLAVRVSGVGTFALLTLEVEKCPNTGGGGRIIQIYFLFRRLPWPNYELRTLANQIPSLELEVLGLVRFAGELIISCPSYLSGSTINLSNIRQVTPHSHIRPEFSD